jgi:hypothetical protein
MVPNATYGLPCDSNEQGRARRRPVPTRIESIALTRREDDAIAGTKSRPVPLLSGTTPICVKGILWGVFCARSVDPVARGVCGS